MVTTRQVYLDYQSAKPVDPRVTEAMMPYLTERFGNPSSLHSQGDEATEALESSREGIARFIGARPEEIVFTSGATEATNLAMIGYAQRNRQKGNHVVISEMEHISVHNTAKYLERNGFEVSRVPLDQYGQVNLRKLRSRIRDETILVALGYASNEIGTVQPVREVGEMLDNKDIALFSDAVAAEGLLPIDVEADKVHLLSLSSNDIYGPRGLGVLYVRKGVRVAPTLIGGGQERGLRSGSENVPAMVGMAKAADIMKEGMEVEVRRLQGYRDRLIEGLLGSVPKSYLNGHPVERLPNNAHLRFAGIEGESLLLSLRDEGISVATGSACSSRTLEPSHTLIACGLVHEEAHGSLELTVGRFNEPEDIDWTLEAVPRVVARLRDMSPLWKEE